VIPQDFIQQLLGRVDIVEVVGRHVQLRRAGANFLGLCPFHGEKSPSFTVSPSKQFYHCFGCGAHGSAIGFLMEHAGLGYVDAIRDLARDAGLAVPEVGRADAAEAARQAARQGDLTRLMTEVARFYRERLRDTTRAIEYLKGRGMTGEMAARFGIGYAPAQWRALEAMTGDYDGPALLDAGLVIDNRDESGQSRRYDRFRDRIMFPIRNARAQIVGFGGRVIDSGEPKYMNSPETAVFSKGREIYGVFESREGIRRENCVVVVEGYMDVVMLACHGVDNAVATLGTATTADHLRKLVRLADRLVFAFDGDAAGRKAAWRALETSLPFVADDRRIDFLFLPAEHDPDSFVREQGASAWRDRLNRTTSLSEHLISSLVSELDLEQAEGRAALMAQAGPLLRQLAAPALRMQLAHRIAELARLDVREVDRYLSTQSPNERRSGSGARAQSGGAFPAGDPVSPGRAMPSDARGEGAQWGQGESRNAPRRGRDGSRTGWARPAVRIPVAAPDLLARVRLLLALHPALADQVPLEADWIGASLRDWAELLSTVPANSTFANVCECVRAADPQAAERLQREGVADPGALSTLSAEEAADELRGALAQIEQRWVRSHLEQLVASGIRSSEDRLRYQSLLARSRQFRA
jgi:DNA primase